jgi:hypothetical protein
MVHTSYMLDKQGYTDARTRMHTPTGPVTRTHARAHTQAHKRNIYCFSATTMTLERASMLRYTYITCIVLLQKVLSYESNAGM